MTQDLSERQDLAALPSTLRALLEAELNIGNRIAEIDYGFPAPPVGFCVLLAKPISTRPTAADDGLRFGAWPNWKGYSGYTDAQGHYFLLNPSLLPPPEPEPIRDGHGALIQAPGHPGALPEAGGEDGGEGQAAAPAGARGEAQTSPDDILPRRFRRSMEIGYANWHEGIGYDLEALRAMSGDQRAAVLAALLARGVRDWRDVEALALLDAPAARSALGAALEGGDAEIRLAVARHAPDLVSPDKRAASLVAGLETATFFHGLSDALDTAAEFHPPQVLDALWRGLQEREGEVAVHFAALLAYLHGKADAPFDLALRPLFLTFNTEDPHQRRAAIVKLRQEMGL